MRAEETSIDAQLGLGERPDCTHERFRKGHKEILNVITFKLPCLHIYIIWNNLKSHLRVEDVHTAYYAQIHTLKPPDFFSRKREQLCWGMGLTGEEIGDREIRHDVKPKKCKIHI